MAKAQVKLTFKEMMEQEFRLAQEAVDKRRELDIQVAQLKKDEDAHLRRLTHLNKLAKISRYLNVGVWSEQDVSGRNNHTLKEFKLQTAVYEMYVRLKERVDLKSYKYEVEVSGQHTQLGETPHETNGGYTEFGYIKKKYKDAPQGAGLTEKFKTEVEALAFMETWMLTLTKDHEFEIKEDQKLVKHLNETGFTFDPEKKYYTRYYK